MTMNTLVTIELVKIFVAYFLVVIVPPAIVFSEKLKKRNLNYSFRLMAYLMMGNAFIINLVLYLSLLHICYKWTLILFSFLFYLGMGVFLYEVRIKELLLSGKNTVERMGFGYLGRKTFFAHIRELVFRQVKRIFSGTIGVFGTYPFEVVGFFATIFLVLYLFGSNDYWNLGYTASDLTVHNSWINALNENKPFVDGVYPMGYHCMVFFLHKVFGMDSYVLLRHWEVITIVLLACSIMAFVGYVCEKHTFLAFVAVLLFVLPKFVAEIVYERFLFGIPQEYSHIFVLPSLMFLLEFFVRRKENEEGRLVPSTLCWLLFATGLSLTLSVHFYGSIMLFVFFLGAMLSHIHFIFRKRYFFSLLKAGLLGILIAVLPMGISLAFGNEFQGSMDWAVGIMDGSVSQKTGNTKNSVVADLTDDDYTDDLELYEFMEENGMLDEAGLQEYSAIKDAAGVSDSVVETEDSSLATSAEERLKTKGRNLKKRIVSAWESIVENFYTTAEENIFMENSDYTWVAYLIGATVYLVLFIGIVGIFRGWRFAPAYLTTSVGVGILWIIMASEEFHIPALMDAERARTFFVTFVGIIIAFELDFVLRGLLYFVKKRFIHVGASLLLTAAVILGLFARDLIHEPFTAKAYEYNGAVICLESIMRENEDFTYTVVSANDENVMAGERGYSYEIITFLQRLHLYKGGVFSDAYTNLKDADEGDIHISTPKVYVFIEKVPLDHGTTYANSGQSVSKEGAALPLPLESGNGFYSGESRWICMSKMYYWAQAYMELMQDAMRVYYEDDDFICYEITQNENSSYNFAIDYGYNDCGEGEVKADD